MASIKQEEKELCESKLDMSAHENNSNSFTTRTNRERTCRRKEFKEDKELDKLIKELSESEYEKFLFACEYNTVNPKNLDYQTYLQGKGYIGNEMLFIRMEALRREHEKEEAQRPGIPFFVCCMCLLLFFF